jgi:hypothetical protein
MNTRYIILLPILPFSLKLGNISVIAVYKSHPIISERITGELSTKTPENGYVASAQNTHPNAARNM